MVLPSQVSDDLWDLEYWIGQRKVETLEYAKPKALCFHISKVKSFLEDYKKGKFKIKRHEQARKVQQIKTSL